MNKRQRSTIRDYRASDRPALDRLWRRYFGSWSADGLWKRWRWQFETNPYCAERPARNLVLTVDDELVGYMGSIPIPLRLDGRRQVGLCGTGFVVDEGHRFQAMRLIHALTDEPPFVGSSMSPAAQKLFRGLGGQLVSLSLDRFTFQLRHNGAACIQARRRLRRPLVKLVQPWMLGPVAERLAPPGALPVRRLPPSPAADGAIRPVTSFGSEYEALWASASERISRSVDRTARYMTWRYLECPTLHPICLAYHDARGRQVGVVVALRRGERDWTGGVGVVHGEIAELLLAEPDEAVARSLLLAALHALDRSRVDSVTATGLRTELHPLLDELGFQREQTDTFALGLILESREATAAAVGDEGAWYVSAGDGENVFATSL